MIYVDRGRRRLNCALAHNYILQGENTVNGVNGFRYFWLADRAGWSVRRCG
jgi:hypothetical protein